MPFLFHLSSLHLSFFSFFFFFFFFQIVAVLTTAHSLLRLLLGIVVAGMWPGMSYYLTLFYPPSRCGTRIGNYYTAAQLSAAVVGLVSAGFQKMDGLGGLVGFQWMFLLWGLSAVLVGIVLLWWLPPRPRSLEEEAAKSAPQGWKRFLPRSPPALRGEDAEIHRQVMAAVYDRPSWTWRQLGQVMIDWRIWPLVMMYFGVVGVGMLITPTQTTDKTLLKQPDRYWS